MAREDVVVPKDGIEFFAGVAGIEFLTRWMTMMMMMMMMIKQHFAARHLRLHLHLRRCYGSNIIVISHRHHVVCQYILSELYWLLLSKDATKRTIVEMQRQ